jgi:hypothetical protein
MPWTEFVNPLLGKTIREVKIAEDGMALLFCLYGGELELVRVDADCCSTTWIEHIEGADALPGATVLSVEEIDMPDSVATEEDRAKAEVLQVYGCKITTNKGTCIIDYRNDSNGYYGGNLCWGEQHFYGGLYGQNVSNLDWKELSDV